MIAIENKKAESRVARTILTESMKLKFKEHYFDRKNEAQIQGGRKILMNRTVLTKKMFQEVTFGRRSRERKCESVPFSKTSMCQMPV